MLKLRRAAEAQLRRMEVRIDVPDPDTVLLRGVPLDTDAFSKSHTNVLLKRPREGLPFVVFVDEDLEYIGAADEGVALLLARGPVRNGWRALSLERDGDLQAILDRTLAVLGVDDYQPEGGSGLSEDGSDGQAGLLGMFGTNWSEIARDPQAEPTAGRQELVAQAAGTALRWGQQRLCLIVGESGVGKTNLLAAVARRLAGVAPQRELISVSLGHVFAGTWLDADRENLLRKLLSEAPPASRG
ncbi:MAG: hypothetical protein ACODAJ_05950, partial [Planctomycetota bacterium]